MPGLIKDVYLENASGMVRGSAGKKAVNGSRSEKPEKKTLPGKRRKLGAADPQEKDCAARRTNLASRVELTVVDERKQGEETGRNKGVACKRLKKTDHGR